MAKVQRVDTGYGIRWTVLGEGDEELIVFHYDGLASDLYVTSDFTSDTSTPPILEELDALIKCVTEVREQIRAYEHPND